MNMSENTFGRRVPRVETALPRRVKDILALLEGLENGSVVISLPGAGTTTVGRGDVVAHWMVKDLAMFDRLLATGDIGLGESWIDGQWHCDDLSALLTWLARNRAALGRAVYGRAWRLMAYRIWHMARANTRAGSRRNIEAHYDLGNDFYRLWLDPTMTYSAACFAPGETDLAAAQQRKYRRILDALDVRPGQRILEIGCGWGGFAEVAVREAGCSVLGLTLSPAQREYASARAAQGGWDNAALFGLCDYRDVRGEYDHVVSIEMIEAVGERFWPTYFETVSRCLKPGGNAVIQSITIDDALFARYRRGTDFIQRYVFPGGMLPSPERIDAGARAARLEPTGCEMFGEDYARTLRHWDTAFAAQHDAVRALGFDARFVRLWHFYLAYCEAGFLAGNVDVGHFRFTHASGELQ